VLAGSTRGNGERLVLIHGFTQSAGSFDRVAAGLARSREVMTVDLPGHGRSAEVEVEDLESTADAVGATGGEATYVGYSLGGRVALTLALRRPGLVRRLVLIGASPGIADPEERGQRLERDEELADFLDPDVGEPPDLESFLDRWLAQPLFSHLGPVEQDRPARRVNTPRGLGRSLRATGTGRQRPSHHLLGTLSMPTLLVVGAADEKFRAIAEEMAAAIGSGATLSVVEGAHHAVPFEQPDRFVEVVEGWLATRA
jgi:2-succinyl-6-hydroxy-2,4-cyclohexadiene-1-carboxylate synthase